MKTVKCPNKFDGDQLLPSNFTELNYSISLAKIEVGLVSQLYNAYKFCPSIIKKNI